MFHLKHLLYISIKEQDFFYFLSSTKHLFLFYVYILLYLFYLFQFYKSYCVFIFSVLYFHRVLPFTVGGQSFSRGTVTLCLHRNPQTICGNLAKGGDANVDSRRSDCCYQLMLNSLWTWLRNRMQSRKKITAPACKLNGYFLN